MIISTQYVIQRCSGIVLQGVHKFRSPSIQTNASRFVYFQIVWFVSCFGVILMGVDVGLGIGLICALFVVVVVLSR